MCRLCHSDLLEEDLIDMLEKEKTTKQFSVWNTTSVSHMFLAARHNSSEARTLALELLDEYVLWAEQNPGLYYGKKSVFDTPDIDSLKERIAQLKQHVLDPGFQPYGLEHDYNNNVESLVEPQSKSLCIIM